MLIGNKMLHHDIDSTL